MIELNNDSLAFSFPGVHRSAKLTIHLQRTLRIPDDDNHKAIEGAGVLAGMKSVAQLGKEKGDIPLPENQPVAPDNIVKLTVRRIET